MENESRQAHWENVYASKSENEVSWFQENPAPSLALIAEIGAKPASAIIDVGGGASRLVDHLIEQGFHDVTVPDLSAAALEAAKARLGDRADKAHWRGHSLPAPLAPDAPEKCSGLPVMRYDAARLAHTLGSGFKLLHSQRNEHATPWGSQQLFQFSVFQRAEG